MTDRVVLEFTVEPFVAASPGPHVTASIDAARRIATTLDVGPFGTTATGTAESIADITRVVVGTALSNGASRVSLQVTTNPDQSEQEQR